MRRCDGCTMCCFLPEVREFDKPLNTWCEHCAIGTGCTVYKHRPQGCRDFVCLWLANSALPDEARPDRCGVMFEALTQSRTVLAMVDPGKPDAWQREPAAQVIGTLLHQDVAVVVTCQGYAPQMLAPPGRPLRQVRLDLQRELEAVR